MIVQETEFEVATRRRLHQQKQVPKEFLKYMSHGCVFLRWCRYFPQFVTVIRYSRWVLNEEKKKYIKDVFHSFITWLSDFTFFTPTKWLLTVCNQIILNHTTLYFPNFIGCKFFLESRSPDLLVLCKTNTYIN